MAVFDNLKHLYIINFDGYVNCGNNFNYMNQKMITTEDNLCDFFSIF